MRTKKMQSIIVLVLIISFAYFTYSLSLTNFMLSDEKYSYLGGLTWSRSAAGLEEGFRTAQQENKPIAVYFWAIWCQYCAKFQSDTLGNPQVKKILEEDYVLVAIDLDLDREVAQKYGVSYPPYVLFLDKNDGVLDRIPGAVDAEYFLPVVTEARDKVRSK